MKDVTLSDGTVIPEGTLLCAPIDALHHDESVYANADATDSFRFANLREGEDTALRHQAVNTSYNYLPFGHGKHAWCVSPPYLPATAQAHSDRDRDTARDGSSQ